MIAKYIRSFIGVAIILFSASSSAMINKKIMWNIVTLNTINAPKELFKLVHSKKGNFNQKRLFSLTKVLCGQKGWEAGKKFGESIAEPIANVVPEVAEIITRNGLEDKLGTVGAEIVAKAVESVAEHGAPVIEQCMIYTCGAVGCLYEEVHQKTNTDHINDMVDVFKSCIEKYKDSSDESSGGSW